MTETPPQDNLSARIESLLFAAPSPVTVGQLATALDVSPTLAAGALEELQRTYTDAGVQRGLRIQRHGGRVQLTTAPEYAEDVEHFLGLEATSRLSQAALEALAIIAYRQPATRPQVDAVRGVNSDAVLKSLLSKGLIQEVGRAETPGRPILYSTTPEFLQYFGLDSLEGLPPLEELEEEASLDASEEGESDAEGE